VKSPTDLHNHHHADDLLEDYILGTLPAGYAEWMQAHLESCPRCQAEFAPLVAGVQALPFAAPEPDVRMSDDLWDRIERSISSSPGAAQPRPIAAPVVESGQPVAPVRSLPQARMTPRQWMMVAALMLVSLLGGTLLGQVLPQFDDGEEIEGQQIAIQFTDPSITATGKLRYLPDEQVFVLDVTGMPELPEGYVYQAWLIQGDEPVPVGVMRAESGEIASAGDRDAFETFAITVEEGPLGNPEPTSDPILVASLEPGNDES
jgi:anti-sigma-K factor RskA